MKKINQNINKIRCDYIENEEFENLLEEDLMDIESFLDSYIVNKVDEEKVDSTIEILRAYMPKEEILVETVKESNNLLGHIKNNVDLVKFQLRLIDKVYLVLSLLLILIGTITTLKLNLDIYVTATIIAPMPVILGVFELIKGRDDNVWELELSYKYSLREIILSRLVIINIISVVISIGMSIVLSNTYSEIGLLKMIAIWLIPIFIVSTISLSIVSVYRSINSIALCIGIWILGISSIVIYENIATVSNFKLLIILSLSIIGTVISSKLFYKKSINYIDYKGLDF